MIFVTTSGCTWNQLPPGFGLSGVTAFRRFTELSQARVWSKFRGLDLHELGPVVSWAGRGAQSTQSAAVLSMGAADVTESDRPPQERVEKLGGGTSSAKADVRVMSAALSPSCSSPAIVSMATLLQDGRRQLTQYGLVARGERADPPVSVRGG